MVKTFRVLMVAALLLGVASLASADHKDCPKDLNADGKVDSKDMAIIENAMGSREGVRNYDERADLNQDGFVTISDRELYPHCRL